MSSRRITTKACRLILTTAYIWLEKSKSKGLEVSSYEDDRALSIVRQVTIASPRLKYVRPITWSGPRNILS